MDTRNDTQDDGGNAAALDEDVLFDLLQNSRRRALLRHLEEHDELQLSTLAELIAAEENGVEPDEISEDTRRSVYISLYQTHVPKLAEHGVVAYDRHESTVRLLDTASQLLAHIYLDESRCTDGSPSRKLPGIFDRWFRQ